MMRRIIEEITCDVCGQVYQFEKAKVSAGEITMRLEGQTDWMESLGWRVDRIEGSGFRTRDSCPACVGRRRRP